MLTPLNGKDTSSPESNMINTIIPVNTSRPVNAGEFGSQHTGDLDLPMLTPLNGNTSLVNTSSRPVNAGNFGSQHTGPVNAGDLGSQHTGTRTSYVNTFNSPRANTLVLRVT